MRAHAARAAALEQDTKRHEEVAASLTVQLQAAQVSSIGWCGVQCPHAAFSAPRTVARQQPQIPNLSRRPDSAAASSTGELQAVQVQAAAKCKSGRTHTWTGGAAAQLARCALSSAQRQRWYSSRTCAPSHPCAARYTFLPAQKQVAQQQDSLAQAEDRALKDRSKRQRLEEESKVRGRGRGGRAGVQGQEQNHTYVCIRRVGCTRAGDGQCGQSVAETVLTDQCTGR